MRNLCKYVLVDLTKVCKVMGVACFSDFDDFGASASLPLPWISYKSEIIDRFRPYDGLTWF